ncbi:transposase [Candidatus Palauibacter sp.]|uniref:transposase n=1 Tax=Candidatus Palauibacter sp. TaxID=3101350 RepID=UPI003B0297CA
MFFPKNITTIQREDRCSTQRQTVSFACQGCQGRKVTAAFNGGTITTGAGALLLREIGRDGGMFDRIAGCFTAHRDQRLTEHSVATLVAQRIAGLALGYEDLNDHDHLRHDPVLGLLAGKLKGRPQGLRGAGRQEHAQPARTRPGRRRAGPVPPDQP